MGSRAALQVLLSASILLQADAGQENLAGPAARHPKLFFLTSDGAAGSFAGASVGMSTLTMHRQTTTMTKATITADVHETLDAAAHFTAQIAFHLVILKENIQKGNIKEQ